MENNRRIVDSAKGLMGTVATWTRLISILQFVGAALTLISAIKIMNTDWLPADVKSSTLFSNIISIAINVTLFLLLFKFGNFLKKYLETNDVGHLETGFKSFKNFSVYLAVLMIIIAVFFTIAFLYVMTL